MTASRDPDPILAAWLDEGPSRLPVDTCRAILVATRTTRQQRRQRWLPWRTSMLAFTRVAVAAIALVIVGRLGLGLFDSSPAPGDFAGPLDTSAWTTYISDRYGFSIGHPADWTERPGDHTWSLANDSDWLTSASEGFQAPGHTVLATAWSVPVKPGTTDAAWIQAYCEIVTTSCAGLADQTVPVTMDGHPGSLVKFVEDTQAFILVGDRMYVVAVWEPDSDPRTASYGGAVRLLEGYLSTMHLLPGSDAVHTGLLDPGSYTDFAVDQDIFNVAFTVPSGWSWDGRALTKSAGNRSVAASISFYAGPVDVYADPCRWSGASSATRVQLASADALMTALGAQLARDPSPPVDRSADSLTVAGNWPGKAVNLTVPAELDLSSCDQGQFRSWGPDARLRVNEGAGEHDLVWAVDLQGNGVSVPGEMLIIDAGTFPDTPLDVVAEVDRILASIKTGHWR
jgi:hypothetical protein